MHFRMTKYVKNCEIHEEDLRRLWGFFSAMAQELIGGKIAGVAGLTIKSDAYGEICGESDDVIDEAMLRRKPITEVVFRYTSKDLQSRVSLCLQDEFSGFYEVGHGVIFELEGSNRWWFDATIRRFEDIVETLPRTPLYSRLLCRFRWLVSALLSLALSFGFMRVLCKWLTQWVFGREYPEWANRILMFIFAVLIVLFYTIITTFISKNCPVVDLALFKNRANVRQRCLKFFWWVLGSLGVFAIGMILSPSEPKVKNDTGSSSVTTNEVQVSRQPFPSANSIEGTR